MLPSSATSNQINPVPPFGVTITDDIMNDEVISPPSVPATVGVDAIPKTSRVSHDVRLVEPISIEGIIPSHQSCT